MTRVWFGLGLLVTLAAAPAASQSAPDIVGTWQFDLDQGEEKEGPRTVIIRPDSSASYGEEVVRWRIVDEKIWIALGGEWEVYALEVKGNRMTLSGGGLPDPVEFNRTGPPSPRPEGVAVPPVPARDPITLAD